MRGDEIRAKILNVKILPNCDHGLMAQLDVPAHHNALGLITTNIDDVSYAALDEATKKADVQVAYARSMYAGSSNASTKYAGEFIGILSGPDPSDVSSGLQAMIDYINNDSCFFSANDDDTVVYFNQTISRTGSYLSKLAKVSEGVAMSYLIAPPLEAMYAMDFALKAADVELKVFYGPPTETNFAGGLLVGEQSACNAACRAFADAVEYAAAHPDEY
jgi:ethanolamine utilization protein EutL